MPRSTKVRYVVVGTYGRETVCVGAFHEVDRAQHASAALHRKGWAATVIPLSTPGEVPSRKLAASVRHLGA